MPRRRTPQRSSVAQRGPVPLNKLEHKFDACPKEEIFYCWQHELARELDWLCEFAAKQKAKKLEKLAQTTGYYFLAFPQWPAEPYLSIEQSERQRLFRRVRPTEMELDAGSLLLTKVPEAIEELLRDELRRSGKPVIKDGSKELEAVLFEINWRFPDSWLRRSFDSYLKVNRPIKPMKHRARNDPDARRRQELKELGLFRLLRANNDFSVNAIHKVFGAEIPLAKVDAWYNARTKTEALIKKFDTYLATSLQLSE
jgi:hypothetical protein